MIILGINISHHTSICIYENGKIKKLYNEERFNLEKNWAPDEKNFEILQSINQKINFKPDFVCYASATGASTVNKEYKIIEQIQKQLKNPPYFFDNSNHHLYHALSCFYFSKFDEAAAIIVDGGGAVSKKFSPYREIQTIFYVNKKSIVCYFKHNTNRMYQFPEFCNEEKVKNYAYNYLNVYSQKAIGGRAFIEGCEKIGMKGTDAGKLMGLSSYANSKNKFNLNYDHVKIANDIQIQTFNETCDLIEIAKTKSKNILLSGGYFLNCSNNFKYVKKYPDLNFFVDPIPNDSGTCIGACIYYDNYK